MCCDCVSYVNSFIIPFKSLCARHWPQRKQRQQSLTSQSFFIDFWNICAQLIMWFNSLILCAAVNPLPPILIGKLVTVQVSNCFLQHQRSLSRLHTLSLTHSLSVFLSLSPSVCVSSKPCANKSRAYNMQEVEYQFNQALPAGAFTEKWQPKCISNSTAVASHSCLPCKQTALMAPACWAI